MKKKILIISFAVVTFCFSMLAFALDDMEDSHDHPKFPRIEGTNIVGYDYSNYDEGTFQKSIKGRELLTEKVEGKRTQIMYLGPKELSSLGVRRYYTNYFAELGKVTEKFSCRDDCFNNLGQVFIWHKDARIPSNLYKSSRMYSSNSGGGKYGNQFYWYGTVKSDDVNYTVSVYSAIRAVDDPFNDGQYIGQPIIHLEIIEN